MRKQKFRESSGLPRDPEVSQEPGLPDCKAHVRPHLAHTGTDCSIYSTGHLFAVSRFRSNDPVHGSLSTQRYKYLKGQKDGDVFSAVRVRVHELMCVCAALRLNRSDHP